ncbi:MAG: hypothetical protein JNK56_20975 [Myxococcales bacterium]|nr:hypothetical protein [Myxococcales bacterium]
MWIERDWAEAEAIDRKRLPLGTGSTYEMGSPRAVVRGLCFRPLVATMADTLAWWDAQGEAAEGMTRAEEQAVIAAWRAFVE